MAADGFAAARTLAQWRRHVEHAWPAVAVLHVDSQLSGSGDAQVGDTLTLRAEVVLGDLAPEDVEVQAVYGAVTAADDRLSDVESVSLRPATSTDGVRRYEGEVPLRRTGGFGYTVRVLPRHDLLAAPVELGLVATA
jgi:starch phosphorylase